MFTSKLPISTSVRRPTVNPDGSTSFIGANRASNIPVSVRKANLFTPQTSRRPFVSGASTAGKSFTSGMTTDRKQPRSLKPNPDRDEQMRMFDALVTFLKNNAGHITPPEPRKFFASVSTSESSRIFEFLISRLLPDFKYTKLETSVPEALTQLDYPYIRSVTRSALVSVTTRQAAVGLLVIFDWLIEYFNDVETSQDDEVDELDDPDEIFNELHKNVFLYGENAKEASRASFEKIYQTYNLQAKEDESDQVREEIIRIKQSLEDFDEMEIESFNQDENIDKWKEYYDRMNAYMESKQVLEKEEVQVISKLEIQNEELVKRSEKLDLECKNHELNIDEVEKHKKAIDALKSELSLKSTQLKEAELKTNQSENDYQRWLNELNKGKVKKISDLRNLLDVYLSYDSDSKLWAERKSEINEWISRLDQVPCEDMAQYQKLKRELSHFRQKLRGTESGLETDLTAGLLALESECDELATAFEGNPKILLKLKNEAQRKELELESEKHQSQLNLSKLHECRDNEERQSSINQSDFNNKAAGLYEQISIKKRKVDEFLKASAEIFDLVKQHRENLEENKHQDSLRMLEEVSMNVERWKMAKTIAVENNEIVKKALRRIKRAKQQK